MKVEKRSRGLWAIFFWVLALAQVGCVKNVKSVTPTFDGAVKNGIVAVKVKHQFSYWRFFCSARIAKKQIRTGFWTDDGRAVGSENYYIATSLTPPGERITVLAQTPAGRKAESEFFGMHDPSCPKSTQCVDGKDGSEDAPRDDEEERDETQPECSEGQVLGSCGCVEPMKPTPCEDGELKDADPRNRILKDTVGDPIHLPSGQLVLSDLDRGFESPGYQVEIRRSYNADRPVYLQPFGPGWSWPFGWRMNANGASICRRYHQVYLRGKYRIIGNYEVQRAEAVETSPWGSRRHFDTGWDGIGTESFHVGSFGLYGRCFTDQPVTGQVVTSARVLDGIRQGARTYRELPGGSRDGTRSDLVLTQSQDRDGRTLSFRYEGVNPIPTEIVDSVGRSTQIASSNGRVQAITFPNGETYRYEYQDGYLVAVLEPDGARTEYGYDAVGRLSRRRLPSGSEVVWEYDPSGRITGYQRDGVQTLSISYDDSTTHPLRQVTDAVGQTRTYEVSGQSRSDKILAKIDPGGGRTRYTYEGENLVAYQDPDGRTWQWTYDSEGLVSGSTSPSGLQIQYQREEFSGGRRLVTRVNRSDGSSLRFERNSEGLIQRSRDELGRETSYEFTDLDKWSRVIAPDGAVTSFGYDSFGNLTRVTDPLGDSQTQAVDPLGRVISETDPLGDTTQYEYFRENLLSKVTRPDGSTILWERDDEGRVTGVTDPLGQVTSILWGDFEEGSRPIRVTDPLGGQTFFEYDRLGRLTATLSPQGFRQEYLRDALGRVIERKDPTGAVWKQNYSPGGLLAWAEDPLGNRTVFEYDPAGRLQKVRQPGGEETQFEYDLRSRLVAVVNAEGARSEWEYDLAGQVTLRRDALGKETKFLYDPVGRVLSIQNRRGDITRFVWDLAGQLLERIDAQGKSHRFTYDGAGQLLQVLDPLGRQSSFAYDSLGRVTQRVDALGRVQSFEVDALGRWTSVQNPGGATTRRQFDALGRLTSWIDPLGAETRFEFDADSRWVGLVDPEGNRTEFGHDPRGLRTSSKDPLGHTRTWEYDAAGRMTRSVGARGQSATYSYDANGRVLARTRPEGTESFGYDSVGRRISAENELLSEFIQFDLLGRPLNRVDSRGFVTNWEWDDEGLLVQETRSEGERTLYRYDSMDRLVELEDTRVGLFEFEYDAGGQRTKTVYPRDFEIDFCYDALGRPVQRTVTNTRTQAVIQNLERSYDLAGNLSQEVWARQDGLQATLNLGYNIRDELISAQVQSADPAHTLGYSSATYEYDLRGNRLRRSMDGVTDLYGYNELSQLVSRNGESLRYDASGNLVEEPMSGGRVRRYGFDSDNQMVSTTLEVGGDPISQWSFGYDSSGFQVLSQEDLEGEVGQRTHRLYSGGKVVEEVRLQGESDLEDGVWISRIWSGGENLGDYQVSRLSDSSFGEETLQLFFPDAQGTIRSLWEELPPVRQAGCLDEGGACPELVSSNSDGLPGAAPQSVGMGISCDGETILFADLGSGFVGTDPGEGWNYYRKDLRTQETTLLLAGASMPPEFQGDESLAASEDGSFVVLRKYDWDLGRMDLYRLEVASGALVQLNVGSDGQPFSGASGRSLDISNDGGTVLFDAFHDASGTTQIYVWEASSGKARIVSRNSGGDLANDQNQEGRIAGQGRYVIFTSQASNLELIHQDRSRQVYRKDLLTGTLRLVSCSLSGELANGPSGFGDLSKDGSFAVFESGASNLVPGDQNGWQDIFFKDLSTETVERISVSTGGEEGNYDSRTPSVSQDGRFVAFTSGASNLGEEELEHDYQLKIHVRDRQSSRTLVFPGDIEEPSEEYDEDEEDYDPDEEGGEDPEDDSELYLEYRNRIYLAQNGSRPRVEISGDGRYIGFIADPYVLFEDEDYGGESELPEGQTVRIRNPFVEFDDSAPERTSVRHFGYTPFGEPRAQSLEGSHGFQGLIRDPLSSGPDDEIYGAWWRKARPGIGRWTKKDPGGFVDGHNRYRWLRNNPYRYGDPNGLAAVPQFGPFVHGPGHLQENSVVFPGVPVPRPLSSPFKEALGEAIVDTALDVVDLSANFALAGGLKSFVLEISSDQALDAVLDELLDGEGGRSSENVCVSGGRDEGGRVPKAFRRLGRKFVPGRSSNSSSVSDGDVGSFRDLQKRSVVGDGLDLHHVPQRGVFTSSADGAAVAVPPDVHARTRTYRGRGRRTRSIDKTRPFRDVLADDLVDLRRAGGGGRRYNRSARDIIDYYRKNFPDLIRKVKKIR